jgi:hypothetical protein
MNVMQHQQPQPPPSHPQGSMQQVYIQNDNTK